MSAATTSGQNVQKLKHHRMAKIQRDLQKASDNSQKAGARLDRAKAKIPKKKEYSLERVFDEKTGTAKYVIKTVEKERMFKPDGIAKKTVGKIADKGNSFVHSKVAENEKENSAVEAAHKTEQKAEDIYRNVKNRKKSKAQKRQRKIERLEKKKLKADVNFEYKKFLSENPQLDKKTLHNGMQKRIQKQRIKRQYIKAKRAGKTAKEAYEAYTKSSNIATGAAKKLQDMVSKNKSLIISAGAFSLITVMIMSAVTSCGSIMGGVVSATATSTYLSTPAEIDAADLSLTQKEMELQTIIDTIENDYPGYDEYDYNLGEIGHNPYTLANYLSAVNIDFTASGVESQIQSLFDAMYSLDLVEAEEVRTRPVVYEDGTVSEDEVEEYTVSILRVTLTSTPLNDIVTTNMDSEQNTLYSVYDETKGGLQVFESPVVYNWYNYVSSYFGYRKNPNTGNQEYHKGIDIAVPTGTTVYAANDGTVTTAAYDDYYGNYVEITGDDGYVTKYAHMDSISVRQGQKIVLGTVIGESGNTGSSTGSHLHIECLYNGEYYNPLFYFKSGTETLYGESTTGNTGDLAIPESYDDATAQRLINEAEKYLGMPYTFGGTPPTSFDCSGFVSWVFSNSGVYNLPRTTAQGIYNQCTKIDASDAKAGDLIFFTGTYNAGRPVTHVGIYCGNGIMIHCGDPIKYSSVNTSYWQSHFYAYGRLN
jgi:murein DD-endopeptidase MepM/ murein hydrolase activator NlpD